MFVILKKYHTFVSNYNTFDMQTRYKHLTAFVSTTRPDAVGLPSLYYQNGPDRGYTPGIQLRMFNYELRYTRDLITNY